MKRTILRSAAVLGTVGFAGFLLAACSNSSSGSSEASKEINVYVDKGYKSYVEEAAKAFEKENGVKINIKTGDALGGLDNLSLDNQSKKAPDVMMAPYDRVGGLGSDGQLAEVTLNKDSHTDKTTEALVTNGGKVYGAPAVIETLVLYYNKDLVSEAPKTFGDLENLAKDSKYDFASEPGKTTAFLADWTNFYYTYGLLSGNGGYVFGKDGTDPKDIGLNNQGSIDGIEYAKTWYAKWPKGLQDTKATEKWYTFKTIADVETEKWDKDNIKYINLAMHYGAFKILIRVIQSGEDTSKVLKDLEMRKFNWLAYPKALETEDQTVVNWVKQQFGNTGPIGKTIKYVSSYANKTDHVAIVELANGGTYKSIYGDFTAQEYTAAIAGLIAGMPLNRSADNHIMNDLKEVEDYEPKIGKFSLYMDEDIVRVNYGVNSKTTFDSTWKKDTRKYKNRKNQSNKKNQKLA